jgi:hypothetical protein
MFLATMIMFIVFAILQAFTPSVGWLAVIIGGQPCHHGSLCRRGHFKSGRSAHHTEDRSVWHRHRRPLHHAGIVGPDIDMAIECHWKYSVNDVIKYCNAVEHVNPIWVEDPTPPENVETMERVSRATNTPICTGENLYGLSQFAPLIIRQACAGVHIDIPKSGGLFEGKRISDFADL